jgi:peptidoglycan/xylan/chitin deacetylase (PgdA/CDA1 family)
LRDGNEFPELSSELFKPSLRRLTIEPLRDLAVNCLAPVASMVHRVRYASAPHVRFAYYHFVFRDQEARFAEHLRFYRDHYRVISYSEAVARIREGRVDDRYLAISFDDGFKNNAEVAAPILERFGAPAIFFVVAELVRFGPEENRELAAFSRARFEHRPLRNLNRDDLRRLLAAGHEIGSHTLSHARLSAIAPAEAEREIAQSKVMLEEMTGAPVKHFCFPYGLARDFPPYCRQYVERAGYESCASAVRGINTAGADVYALRRDHIMAGWPLSQLKYFTRVNFQ